MVDTVEQDTENFLQIAGPNDIIEHPWASIPNPRPLFDEYHRQNIGTVLAMPQRIISSNVGIVDGFTSDPFSTLMQTTRYVKALSSFESIRGTLVLRATLRSAVTAYGVGMQWWYYGPSRSTGVLQQDIEIASSSHALVFDVPSCPELIHRIPFIHAREYLPKSYQNYVRFGIGVFSLDSIDPSIPPTAYVEVWAHMEDVEVTQYIEAQSLPVAVRQQEYQLPGRASLPMVLAGSGALAGAAQAVVSSFLTEGYSELKKAVFSEAKQGLRITLNNQSNRPVEKVDKTQNVCANTQTPIYSAPWGNVNSFEPTHALQSMTEMPMTKIDPAIFGDTEYHSLADLVQNATFVKVERFQQAPSRVEYEIGAISSTGYVNYVSRHFRFFRGRFRIGLWFACSPLVSARFLIRVGSPAAIAPTGNTDSSVPMHSILVKGSSYHVVEIPWNHDSPIYPTDAPFAAMSIELVNKGEPTTAGYDYEIPVVIFNSFGPGTQFFSVKSPDLSEPPPASGPSNVDRVREDLIEAQSSTRDMSRGEPDIRFTDGPMCPITYIDSIDSVETLCSRWATDLNPFKYVGNEAFPAESYVAPNTNQNSLYGTFPHHFIPLYATWRGSRDFRFLPSYALTQVNKATMSGAETISVWSDLSIANGGFVITPETPHQFRVPFISRYKALLGTPATSLENNPLPLTDLGINNETTIISRASPDFQLFHLNALYPGYTNVAYYELPPPGLEEPRLDESSRQNYILT